MDFKQSTLEPQMGSGGEVPREQAANIDMGGEKQEKSKITAGKSKQKSSSILLTSLIVVLALMSVSLFISKVNLQAKNRLLMSQLEAVNVEKTSLEKQVNEANAIKEQLQSSLDQAKREAEALAAEVAAEKRAKESAMAQLDEKLKENESLKATVESEKQERLAIKEKLEKENEKLALELKQIKIAKDSLEKKLKSTLGSTGVKLEKIVVKPQTAEMAPEGQVLVVNREFDFIVVNLGESDGLKIGSQLQVLKDDIVLGIVEVEKIYGNMSAATISPDADKNKIKEGCIVRPL